MNARESNPYTKLLLQPVLTYGQQNYMRQLMHRICTPSPRSIALYGAPKIGKTTLLHAANTYIDANANRRTNTANSSFQYEVVQIDAVKRRFVEILNQMASRLIELKLPGIDLTLLRQTLQRAEELPLPFDTDEAYRYAQDISTHLLRSARQAYEKQYRFIFCLDHFDYAMRETGPGQEQSFLILRQIAQYASFISTLDPAQYLETFATSPFANLFYLERVELLRHTDAIHFVSGPLQGSKEHIVWDKDEIKSIVRLAGPHPFLLQMVCEYYYDRRYMVQARPASQRLDAALVADIEALPEVVRLFRQLWNGISTQARRRLYRIAKSGVEEQDYEIGVFAELRDWSLVDQNETDGQFTIFSELFRRFILAQTMKIPFDIYTISKELTALDQRVLGFLVDHLDQRCRSEDILKDVWGEIPDNHRGLEASIYRIRQRIQFVDPDWDYIRRIREFGYQFVPRPSE